MLRSKVTWHHHSYSSIGFVDSPLSRDTQVHGRLTTPDFHYSWSCRTRSVGCLKYAKTWDKFTRHTHTNSTCKPPKICLLGVTLRVRRHRRFISLFDRFDIFLWVLISTESKQSRSTVCRYGSEHALASVSEYRFRTIADLEPSDTASLRSTTPLVFAWLKSALDYRTPRWNGRLVGIPSNVEKWNQRVVVDTERSPRSSTALYTTPIIGLRQPRLRRVAYRWLPNYIHHWSHLSQINTLALYTAARWPDSRSLFVILGFFFCGTNDNVGFEARIVSLIHEFVSCANHCLLLNVTVGACAYPHDEDRTGLIFIGALERDFKGSYPNHPFAHSVPKPYTYFTYFMSDDKVRIKRV